MRSAPIASLMVAAVLIAAPAAGAATVGAVPAGSKPVITFTAVAGEVNDVVLAQTAAGVAIGDRGAPLTAEEGCVAVDAHSVTCAGTTDSIGAINVSLGDGADRATVQSLGETELVISGGPGDDTMSAAGNTDQVEMRGDAGNDTETGTDGNDVLEGGDGDDVLNGGPEGDILVGGPGTNRLIGGGGKDIADYSHTRTPVHVDLAAGTATTAGEHDSLSGIPVVVGGHGDDVLLGSRGDDTLLGGPGRDSAAGRGGDDDLTAEREIGGAGDDTLNDPADTPDCGTGDDIVYPPPAGLPASIAIDPSCETVELPTPGSIATRIVRSGTALELSFDLINASPATISVHASNGVTLASGSVHLSSGEHSARVRLTAAGQRELKAGAHPLVKLTVVFKAKVFHLATRLSGH